MTEPNSDIITKIQKVLALATNNPSIEEGQTAMLSAQKIMLENNTSMSAVDEKIKTKEVINQPILETKMSKWWHQHLAVIISDNFKCGVYIRRKKSIGITSIRFVGLKNDVETAKQVYLYAVEVISYNCKKYVLQNSDRISNKGIKNQYILGFLDGLKSKFVEQIKNNNWGLVIVKDPVVDSALKDLNLKKGGRRNITTNGNEQDRLNGYKDGKNFNVISGKLT